MSQESSQSSIPNAQDLVLGGQLPPPIGGAVLGGLTGLEQRFHQSQVEQKMAALAEAKKYGESALPLLHQGLEDADLQVRMAAFLQLKSMQTDAPELERGLPLKVGDRIYAVYESSVSYGDDFYYIHSQIHQWEEEFDEWEEERSIYHSSKDFNSFIYEYLSDAPEDNQRDPYDEDYDPNLIAYYLNSANAEKKAELVYEEKFGKLGCEIYEVDRYSQSEDGSSEEFDLEAWVEANQVVVDAKLLDGWEDDDWTYENHVLTSLQNQKQFSLLRKIWQQKGYPPLAFVHEYVIDRPCYLRLAALETR